MKIRLFFIFLILSVCGIQAQSIKTVLQSNNIVPEKNIEGDIWVTDTVQNESFYQLLFQSTFDTISLFEAKIIPRGKDTLILGIKGYESDMQCTFHHSKLYTVTQKNKSPFSVESAFNIKPGYLINAATVDSIINLHLPEIQDVYLDPTSTVEDVFNEIYTLKYSFSPNNDVFKLTYSICDYIYVNYGVFSEEEWTVINDVKTISISFPQ